MNADQLLDRMLAFANSSECPLIDKPRVINAAYKTWIDTIELNKYSYSELKGEKIEYVNGIPFKPIRELIQPYKKNKMTAADWIRRRKESQYNRRLKKIIELENN